MVKRGGGGQGEGSRLLCLMFCLELEQDGRDQDSSDKAAPPHSGHPRVIKHMSVTWTLLEGQTSHNYDANNWVLKAYKKLSFFFNINGTLTPLSFLTP